MQLNMKFFRRLHRKEMKLVDRSDEISFRYWLRKKMKSKEAKRSLEGTTVTKKVIAIINTKKGSK